MSVRAVHQVDTFLITGRGIAHIVVAVDPPLQRGDVVSIDGDSPVRVTGIETIGYQSRTTINGHHGILVEPIIEDARERP